MGWGGLASLGLVARTRCLGRGGGGAAAAGGPLRAGVNGWGPKLAEALPRVTMAPGKLAACDCMCVCARACVGGGVEGASSRVCFLEALGRGERRSKGGLLAACLAFSSGKRKVIDTYWRSWATSG